MWYLPAVYHTLLMNEQSHWSHCPFIGIVILPPQPQASIPSHSMYIHSNTYMQEDGTTHNVLCIHESYYEIRAQTDCPLTGPSAAPPSKRQSPWATLEFPPATQAISRAFVTTLGNLFFYSLFHGGAVSHATHVAC